MKVASWGYCVLVFDSSGEPVTHPGDTSAVVPGFFGSDFEVGRISSCDEVASRDKISHGLYIKFVSIHSYYLGNVRDN